MRFMEAPKISELESECLDMISNYPDGKTVRKQMISAIVYQ